MRIGGEVMISGVVMITPLAMVQYFAYSLYCTTSNPNLHLSPWCFSFIPDVYNYVQKKYWGVGLFQYYSLHQLPNFLLAAPILLISLFSLFFYFIFHLRSFLRRPSPLPLFCSSKDDVKYGKMIFDINLIIFYIHWAILIVISLTILHVQVTTRFLSSTPPIYWISSYLLLFPGKKRITIGRGRGRRWISLTLGDVVLLYYLIFIVVGATLHVNFLPWT